MVRLKDIGNVVVGALTNLEADQAHSVRRFISAVSAEPNDTVKSGALRIKAVNEFIAGLASEPRDPKVSIVSEPIKPRERRWWHAVG